MRKFRAILGRAMLFVLLFVMLTSLNIPAKIEPDGTGGSQPGLERGWRRPAGRWTTSCDPILNVLRIKWTSDMRLEGGVFIIESEFTNYSLGSDSKKGIQGFGGSENSTVVAFKVMLQPDTIALEIMSDGRFAPENTGFNQSVVVYAYPGGYDALVKDLNSHGTDREGLYKVLKSDAKDLQKYVDENFCTPRQRKHEWPGTLTG